MRLRLEEKCLHGLARLAGAVLLAAGAAAQGADFPARPERIVVPIGPGSSMDIIARVLAQKLNESWEQPVIVDNRAGAGGRPRAVNRVPACGMRTSASRDARRWI